MFMILGTYFILSQIAMLFAMAFDFISMQFKKKEYLFLCLVISSCFIATHYFLLNKIAAGVIICFSAIRFFTRIFTNDKRFLYLFIALNTISLFFTYSSPYDLILYFGVTVFIIGNFQKDERLMRKIMMLGTTIIITYNAIIFSPMGVIAESLFLVSNIIGYYRHYVKKSRKKR